MAGHRAPPAVAVWTVQHLAAFLTAVTAGALYALWWLIALRGLRRGIGVPQATNDLTGLNELREQVGTTTVADIADETLDPPPTQPHHPPRQLGVNSPARGMFTPSWRITERWLRRG